MNELIPKYERGKARPIEDIELAHASAIALDALIAPAQARIGKIKEETHKQAHHAMSFLEHEHYFRQEKGKNTIFPNIQKLIPGEITLEEYDSFEIEVREELLREAGANRGFLVELLTRAGVTSLDELDAQLAQAMLQDYNEQCSHFTRLAMSNPIYQGAKTPKPYSQTNEFRLLHRGYLERQKPKPKTVIDDIEEARDVADEEDSKIRDRERLAEMNRKVQGKYSVYDILEPRDNDEGKTELVLGADAQANLCKEFKFRFWEVDLIPATDEEGNVIAAVITGSSAGTSRYVISCREDGSLALTGIFHSVRYDKKTGKFFESRGADEYPLTDRDVIQTAQLES